MFTLHNPTKLVSDSRYYFVTSHPCPNCKETETIPIASDRLYAYNQGAYAQDVLSGYDADVRERFISGMCGDCWSAMFADFDDE